MPFIIIFNIIMCVCFFLSACVFVFLNFAISSIEKKKEITEEKEKVLNKYIIVRKYNLYVFLGLLAVLMIINLIF